MILRLTVFLFIIFSILSCKKDDDPIPAGSFSVESATLNGNSANGQRGIGLTPSFVFKFNKKVDIKTVDGNVRISGYSNSLNISVTDSTISMTPVQPLNYLTKYEVIIGSELKSIDNITLNNEFDFEFYTLLDPSDKFPRISDEGLLDSVQRRTFAYFWEFGHPVSGLARERNSSGDLVTSGGSGFGLMTIPVGIERGFITKSEGLERSKLIVDFLLNKTDTYHGAFPHWFSGSTGKTIPFSANDNGADLVETSFLMAGLLTLRQYFDGNNPSETQIRDDINTLWSNVEWSWFRKNNEDVLYWHWSPDKAWIMNLQIRGWNECLITYLLATSSPTHAIPTEVYHKGWASNGGIKNNKPAYSINLPLGNGTGGPLFFEHYTFLGIDPNGLKDDYADYGEQTKAHTLINRAYCIANPKKYYGYSAECWGLTAGDISNGYTASSPSNDVSVITPTAAISSMPYTPEESMQAMRFFYYKLGNKLWGPMGFYDGFSLHNNWFAKSTLAIDQGPIVVMIENHRTKLIWDLLMSAPEIKTGMQSLGFTSPRF
ncbi:MAG: Ig-like domain-containing protein [Saprospiraceae bacterium]|jgi:hypothetical protein|nr:Ig-like domain-containing protein [Candidatus Brachybacter algidus]